MTDASERAASLPPDPKAGDIVADKYRIGDLLGEGGMGQVFAGENLRTGKGVALKCLLTAHHQNDDVLLRFRQEARAAGRIDHPNVIQVYDVIEDGPWTFLVMERLRGETLSSMLHRKGRVGVQNAVAIVIEALRGVGAAHDRGVVHRDLKPENIFLSRSGGAGRVKLLDFGVSKLAASESVSVTRTGTVVGTPYYMAPEQVRAVPDLDHRLDVYAMGAVLYHALAGDPPFNAESLPALAVQIVTEKIEPLHTVRPEVSQALWTVVSRALARDRDERFQDAQSFASALEPFGGGVSFRPEGPEWTGQISTDSSPPPAGLGHSSTIRAVSTEAATIARDDLRPAGKKRIWAVGVVLLAVAVLVGALAFGGGDDGAQHGEQSAPPEPEAVAEPQAPIAEDDPPAEDLGATEQPPEQDTAVAVDLAPTVSEPDTVEAAVAESAPRSTMRRRRHVPMGERTMDEPSAMMSTPRAGSLSVEEF